MKKIKKTAAAFLACALMFTGCSKNVQNKNSDSISGTDASNAPGKTNASETNADKTASDAPEAMLLEHDIPLPDAVGKKETVISIVLNGKQGVELFSHDKKNDVFQYVLQNDKWEKQKLSFPEQIRESAGLDRLEILRGEDGKYYAFYSLADETYHLQAASDLKNFEELSPPQWQEAPDSKGYVIPAKVRISENGILCAVLKYEDVCRMYDLKNNGKILDEFGISSYKSLEIHGNQLLSETLDGRGNFIYDLEQLKKTFELDDALTGEASYELVSQDEMYACSSNGIYGISSGKWQLLVDSSLNSLSDPSFVWQEMRHDGARIYITFLPAQSLADGKNKEGFVLRYYEYSTDIPQMDTTLTIWGLEENASIKSTLAEFRKEHPTVQVVYEIASDTSGVMTTDDIIRQFNADLFAGNGPDLILLDGLHAQTYIQRDLLYDMGAELSDIKPQLLPGIQTLITEEPYAVPLRIMLPVVVGPQDVLSDSLADFLQKSSSLQTSEMTVENMIDICCHFFSEGLALNQPEITQDSLTEFLELCRQASDKWPLKDTPKSLFSNDNVWMQLGMNELDFTFSYAYGLNQFCDMLDTIDQLALEGIDYHLPADSFIPQGMLAVSRQSENIELAVEFVKKALSASQQEFDFSDGFPVSLQALDSWADRNSELMTAVGNAEGDKWNTQWPSAEIVKRFLQSIKDADQAVFIERYTEELVKDEAVSVISGDTSAKDAAGRIWNQLELYYED